MLFIHSSLSIWSKPAETPAGKRDSRDPARREAAEEAWRIARGKRRWFAEYRRYSKEKFFYIFLKKLKEKRLNEQAPFLF